MTVITTDTITYQVAKLTLFRMFVLLYYNGAIIAICQSLLCGGSERHISGRNPNVAAGAASVAFQRAIYVVGDSGGG
jgi:hypothetical protein